MEYVTQTDQIQYMGIRQVRNLAVYWIHFYVRHHIENNFKGAIQELLYSEPKSHVHSEAPTDLLLPFVLVDKASPD